MPETDPGGETFSEFVAGSLPALLRFGHVLTGDPLEAEELVQDALARSLRRWRRKGADNPLAYVRRVMINTHLTQWRRWGSRVQLGDVPELFAPDASLRRSEEWDILRRALATLPARQRAVLVLRYLEDLPDPVIASLLGCRPGTVRSLASRGLTALRPLVTAGTTETVPGHDDQAK
ncbi:MAG TPA: SigE family RNA polymerase sigma factor [Streptosporangiaceae bacterium]